MKRSGIHMTAAEIRALVPKGGTMATEAAVKQAAAEHAEEQVVGRTPDCLGVAEETPASLPEMDPEKEWLGRACGTRIIVEERPAPPLREVFPSLYPAPTLVKRAFKVVFLEFLRARHPACLTPEERFELAYG